MINAADDPQMGREGLAVEVVGSVGVGCGAFVDVGIGVADTSRFMFMPALP